jgi:hypothetical protein
MLPPKKPSTRAAQLRDQARNERQKSLHCAQSSDGRMTDSRKLVAESGKLCHDSKDLIHQSQTRRNG